MNALDRLTAFLCQRPGSQHMDTHHAEFARHVLGEHRAEVLAEAAEAVAPKSSCQCSVCSALREAARTVLALAGKETSDAQAPAGESTQPAPADVAETCTCRSFPLAHRADLHDEHGLVRDITPVATGIWGALVQARCGRCGWQSRQSWFHDDFVKSPAQTVISHHRDELTGACTAGNGGTRPAPDTTPLTVRWDRTVIHPEADPTEDTIVCCIADDGRPVALFLDDEHREALGIILVDPTGEGDQPVSAPDFFQPGHGYTRRDGTTFRCFTVTTTPWNGERLAIGWHTDAMDITSIAWRGLGEWLHEYDGVEPPTGGDA